MPVRESKMEFYGTMLVGFVVGIVLLVVAFTILATDSYFYCPMIAFGIFMTLTGGGGMLLGYDFIYAPPQKHNRPLRNDAPLNNNFEQPMPTNANALNAINQENMEFAPQQPTTFNPATATL